MIKIIETVPCKVSGKTALHVTFNFNQNIINEIKAISGPSIWLKNESCWELPLSCLTTLLDKLTFYDDIELRLLPDEIDQISDPKFMQLSDAELQSFCIPLFKHQVEAINFGLTHPKWLLTHGMGCGKTVTAMSLAEVLHKRGLIEHCLIICAVASLRQNWKKEIQKYSNETCCVLGERITRTGRITYTTVKERVEQLKKPISEFFVVTNIESIREDSVIKAISSGPNKFDCIIVDEIHRCLTGDTVIKTSDGQLTLKQLAEYEQTNLPKVLTYNVHTGKNEFQSITEISVSKPVEDLLMLTIQDGTEQYILKCTKSHKIYTTNRGWVKAVDLTAEDDIKIFS